MLGLFKKNKNTSDTNPQMQYFEEFLQKPHHRWILEDKYLTHAFKTLFDHLEVHHIAYLKASNPYFLAANAQFSCSIGTPERGPIIMIFPDLMRMLKAYVPNMGLAILAHELGHLYHRHYQREISALKAQFEADQFAYSLGFGHELQDILLQHLDSDECQMRLAALTRLLEKEA